MSKQAIGDKDTGGARSSENDVLEVKRRQDRADEENEKEKDELEDGEDDAFHGWALDMSLARLMEITAGVSR